ncbi:MAG TPA: class I SAM-dependent methyltransferase [Solirubrobacteraceae bacterium]|nr:class I SAM-dependent methyltransferase [Solirubrobacteraceae bacterium]
MAESFGADAGRYDRTRPRYPQALIDKIIADLPGCDLLDVGIGTGVSARPFRAAGFRVLGVEVDARMAAFARQDGFEVEVAKFEDWDAAGRTFDLVIAGMTWHWVDPTAGAAKAAALLRPGGRLAAFWNVGQPPRELAQAFSVVYERVLPNTPFAAMPRDPLAAYERFFTSTADEIRSVGAFGDVQRWQLDWQQSYTTAQWLDQVPTFGGHSQFSSSTLEELLDGIGTAIDGIGGSFTMRYAAVAVAATRQQDSRVGPK